MKTTAHVLYIVFGVLILLTAAMDFKGPEDLKANMVKWGFRPGFEKILGVIKILGAVGLFIGISDKGRPLGIAASLAFVLYFVLALGVHVRAKDKVADFVPAIICLVWTIAMSVVAIAA
jgi:hypothetical protein